MRYLNPTKDLHLRLVTENREIINRCGWQVVKLLHGTVEVGTLNHIFNYTSLD